MIESILKQIDLTAKLGQDGSSLQAMNALRIIRETIAKHAVVHPTRSEGERKLSDLGNELHNLSCSLAHDNEEWAEQLSSIARELWSWPQPSPAQAEQAEAERPEVVAVMESNGAGGKRLAQRFPIVNVFVGDELMTVAQHDRIVGALRFKRQQMDRAFTACINERDAALARIAELEKPDPDYTQHPQIVGYARKKELAPLLDPSQPDGSYIYIGLDHPACWAEEPPYEFLTPLYTGPVSQNSAPDGYALVPIEPLLNMMSDKDHDTRITAERQLLSILAAAPGNSAQHSVPEEFSFEYRHPNGESHTVTVSRDQVISEMSDFLFEALCSKFCNCEPVGETNVVECSCDEYAEEFKLLAAAPGKEVPQAWIDVQAERRRQVTAEGWTPEHDDAHTCDEIAAFACFYAMPPAARDWDASSTGYGSTLGEAIVPEGWEPKTGDRRRELVKAGGLILAEIERLDRAAMRRKDSDGGAEQ